MAQNFKVSVKLNSNQEAAMRQWVQEGQNLSQIQAHLNALLAPQSLTYMEVRFLLDDLGLEIQAKAPSTEVTAVSNTPTEPEPLEPAALGKVQVTLNPIQRPGMLATGDVTFSDGEKAEWYFDEMGRIGLMPTTAGYRPSAEDGVEFQKSLRHVLGG